MIVIGSYALALLGHRPFEGVKDIDLVGTADDAARFRETNAAIIKREKDLHGHRINFMLVPGQVVGKVEIETEQSESDKMLAGLCSETATILGMEVQVPPVEALYLLKRSHVNVPVTYDKAIQDMLALKPLIGEITPELDAFYRARKSEVAERFALHRQRFKLSIPNEEFFNLSNHIRFYVHDDLHEAVAHAPGEPLYKKCKRDLSLAKIDTDLFEELSREDQLRMVQEEFMVIGVERYFLRDRSLKSPEVYEKGMHKTVRDLFVGYFQDFCIDHMDELIEPPPYDFVTRFCEAEQEGRVRKLEIEIPPPNKEHERIWGLIQKGKLDEARRLSEDMALRAEHGIDPHAYFLLGVTLFRGKRFPAAEKCLRRCVTRDRNNARAWFFLGATLRAAGKTEGAIKALQRAAQLGFRQFPLHWNLGLAFEQQAMPKQAIAAYQRAQALRQDDPRPARRLAALGAA